MHTIFKILLLAAAYFIAAKFGALFTVPPYFSAVVWPGAGIALATLIMFGQRYWVGVMLGAIAVNVQHSPSLDFSSLVVSFFIAAGASLQAVLGCYLCRRVMRFPNVLEEISAIIKLFVFGGVVACFTNSVIGTATLYFAGIISQPDIFGHWFFWWLGDVAGVIAFAPAVLLLTTRSSQLAISPGRKMAVTGVMLFAFFVTGAVYTLAQRLHQTDKQRNFDEKISSVEREFEVLLRTYQNVLFANDQFFVASNYVSASEFEQFTEKFFDLYPGIYALSWIPEVTGGQRTAHLTEIRKQGFPDYQILDRVGKGEMSPAPERGLYFPIAYIVPHDRNKSAHGFDVYGPDPLAFNVRKRLLDRGRTEDLALSTGRISIVQAENQFGLLIYQPIFNDERKSGERTLLGYTAGVFVVPRMLEVVKSRAQSVGAEFVLFDITDTGPQFLYDSRDPEAKDISRPLANYRGLHVIKDTEFGGRGMQLYFMESATIAKQFNWLVASASVAVLLLLSLLSLLSLSLSGRADFIQKLVRTKTRELEEANAELEEFAYRTSHDLRSPLVSSIGLLKYIGTEIPEDKPRLSQSVSIVQGSLEKLETLVADILDLTKIKHITEDRQAINTGELIERCLEKLSLMEGFSEIRFDKRFAFTGQLMGQKDKVTHVIENLLSNAVKYRDASKPESTVCLATFEAHDRFVFEIADNGIGIPKNKQAELFSMFHRFHPKVAYGSGLGLYMIDKSVKAMGGTIEFVDTGDGSLFRVSLPL